MLLTNWTRATFRWPYYATILVIRVMCAKMTGRKTKFPCSKGCACCPPIVQLGAGFGSLPRPTGPRPRSYYWRITDLRLAQSGDVSDRNMALTPET